jgi:hypothetical protein
MLKIESPAVFGFEAAIRGMRNPMNSWDRSDSVFCGREDERCSVCEERHMDTCQCGVVLGKNDLALMASLAKAGPDHRKFMRMIVLTADVTAPLYWWKEYDTYKVGTVANSCSTMHKIHEKSFSLDDFSHEHLSGTSEAALQGLIDTMNMYRNLYNTHRDKESWWQMIQLLPSSYNQRRTVFLSYEALRNIHHARHPHKLDEWRDFCAFLETLPCAWLITAEEVGA